MHKIMRKKQKRINNKGVRPKFNFIIEKYTNN